MYDFITIWAGAAWLFCNLNLPKNSKKLILEKTKNIGTKVLLSWWERANLTNIDINPERDYFSCNKKAMIWLLKRFSNYDIIDFFEKNWVKTKIEDRWRVITFSNHAKDILNVLINKNLKNNTEIKKNCLTEKISYKNNIYEIETNIWKYKTKNLIIATWWKSFSQVWTDGFGYKIGQQFNINIITPYKWLVGIVTKQDLSELSWTTINANIQLINDNKIIYEEYGPLLFTHFWLSWPCIFNTVLAIWENNNCKKNNKDNYQIKIIFDINNTTKKLRKILKLSEENLEIILDIQDIRSWKEAKVTWWWININELTKYMECKKQNWLFFIWEVLDITWKTWGFNLQLSWSTAYACAEKFK